MPCYNVSHFPRCCHDSASKQIFNSSSIHEAVDPKNPWVREKKYPQIHSEKEMQNKTNSNLPERIKKKLKNYIYIDMISPMEEINKRKSLESLRKRIDAIIK